MTVRYLLHASSTADDAAVSCLLGVHAEDKDLKPSNALKLSHASEPPLPTHTPSPHKPPDYWLQSASEKQ
jgi:hypothetical protein